MWYFRHGIWIKIIFWILLTVYVLWGGVIIRWWSFGIYLSSEFYDNWAGAVCLLLMVSVSFFSGLINLNYGIRVPMVLYYTFLLSHLGYFLTLSIWTRVVWGFPVEFHHLAAVGFEVPIYVLIYIKSRMSD